MDAHPATQGFANDDDAAAIYNSNGHLLAGVPLYSTISADSLLDLNKVEMLVSENLCFHDVPTLVLTIFFSCPDQTALASIDHRASHPS